MDEDEAHKGEEGEGKDEEEEEEEDQEEEEEEEEEEEDPEWFKVIANGAKLSLEEKKLVVNWCN